MPSGIQSIVEFYVRTQNIEALTGLRTHRKKLLSALIDHAHYDFSVTRQGNEQDLIAIETGLNQVIPPDQWSIRGACDPFNNTEVTGWVQNEQHPDLPVLVGFYVDGQLVAEGLANLHRPVPVETGNGSGHHGFRFTLPPGSLDTLTSLELRAPFEMLIQYSKNGAGTQAR
jgi:hypothetical protein